MKNITLNHISVGHICTIKEITTQTAMKRRLMDIGLIEGTQVECVLKSPSGDSSAFLIRGAVIALRKEDTANVHISF